MRLLCALLLAVLLANAQNCTIISGDYFLYNDTNSCFIVLGGELNCMGKKILGNESVGSVGVRVRANGARIRNCTVENFTVGIAVEFSDDVYLVGSTARNCAEGVGIRYSTRVSVSGGIFSDNDKGVYVAHSKNCRIINSVMEKNSVGAAFFNSSMCMIEKSGFYENNVGVVMNTEKGDFIVDNVFDGNNEGIGMIFSENCSIMKTNFSSVFYNIGLRSSKGNSIRNSALIGAVNSLVFYNSSNNSVEDTLITFSSQYDVKAEEGSVNFFRNTKYETKYCDGASEIVHLDNENLKLLIAMSAFFALIGIGFFRKRGQS
ncbi:MAG: NosD domain-containing protein [Candidatus Micrarchaeia archaeon]